MDPHQMVESLLPTRDANNGSACMNCMKPSDKLVRCAACRRVKYCNKACQTGNWKRHKSVCKILQLFQQLSTEMPDLLQQLPLGLSDNATLGKINLGEKFNAFKVMVAREDFLHAQQLPKNIHHTTWPMVQKSIMAAKCCAVCEKTDYDEGGGSIEWKCCTRCNYGWTCSEHHEEYLPKHTNEICSNFIQCSRIELFRYNHTINHGDRFMFVPERPLTMPMKSFPETWDEYFKTRCVEEYNMRRHLPDEFFPAATFLLSQVNTCIYGMYLHNKEFFRTCKELTIHVLGPAGQFEYEGGSPTAVWEEIMHCLPAVKTMKLIFVGPEGKLDKPLTDFGACPDCISKGRVRMMGFCDMTYHDYYASDNYIKPDFVAAFNTGMFEEYTESWKESLKVLLDLDVPCIFTSYNKMEGDADFEVLEEMEANTLTYHQSRLNPFHVMFPMIDDSCIDKFFYPSMYYTCFRGAKLAEK